MLDIRWLGRVSYPEALDLQHRLFGGRSNHLLLLEHDHVFTGGPNADPANLLSDPGAVGARFFRTDRGGDITYHGPGQLTGYPVLDVPGRRGGGLADTTAYVRTIEQLLIDVLGDVGLEGCGRIDRYPGVWVDIAGDPRKIAAIGVRLRRGRAMHGFALNVATDLAWFDHIVPCGIREFGVTSLLAEGVDTDMATVVDAVCARAADAFGHSEVERHDVAWRQDDGDLSPFSRGAGPGETLTGAGAASVSVAEGLTIGRAGDTTARRRRRLDEAGAGAGIAISARKPSWMKARIDLNDGYRRLKATMRELDLVTVCEEAGCPNIYECWGEGTATFMINGERCTRACGFCLVDTRKPLPLDPGEGERVAEAVARMQLDHVVVTAVARDDLDDGGAAGFVRVIEAIGARCPGTDVEVLIPDFGGDRAALEAVLAAGPAVLNHNIETVARMQRAVRPSAAYARSLAVLARAAAHGGASTKSGIIVGIGETDTEVDATLRDLAAVGVDIVTIGQYLRPTTHHVPVQRWVEPSSYDRWVKVGLDAGIGHVQASPLTRSSYRAGSITTPIR